MGEDGGEAPRPRGTRPDDGEGFDELVGARVRRIDRPATDLLAVTLDHSGGAGREVLVACTDPRRRAVSLEPERPKGRPAGSFTRKLRKELSGARIERVRARPGVLALDLRRGDQSRSLVVELDGRGNLILLDGQGRVMVAASASASSARGLGPGRTWEPPDGATFEPPRSVHGLREAEAHVERASEDLERRRAALDRAMRRALTRLDRRVEAIESDAARAARAPRLRADASALLAALHAIEPGAVQATVTDWTADPPAERTIDIDPRLGPKAQADAWFHRARRLERGAAIAATRVRETQGERRAVEALRAELREARDEEGLADVAQRARRLGVRGAGAAAGGRSPARAGRDERRRRPYRRFVGDGGREILVGRGAADNDTLTLRVARPGDHWLHARGYTGAHVVVPLDKGETCPAPLLVDAAHLAAHFSDARGEQTVDVIHTPRRYVRKGKGLPPGAVRVDREKVLALRIEPDRLERLLASEDR